MNARLMRIAQREYLAYVRTKTFLVSVLMLPLIFALAFGLPAWMESLPKPPRAFTILDETGRYGPELAEQLAAQAGGPDGVIRVEMRDHVYQPPEQYPLLADAATRETELRELVLRDELFAYFIIRSDSAGCRMDYYTRDVSADRLARLARGILTELVTVDRLRPLVGQEELIRQALQGVTLETHAVTQEGIEARGATQIARSYAPMAFVYLLWIAILSMSSHLMTSTIEEKSSRIVEIILSSVSPTEFLGGKLLGLAAAGLTMIACWIATGVLVSAAVPSTMLRDVFTGLGSAFTGPTVIGFLGFFLLGFLFYAALYIAVGSVCNTLREAQNLLQPVMIMMMLPLFLMFYVANNPDHIVAVIGSMIPPFTPFLMMNRIPANPAPPMWQILLSAVLMVVATWATVRAAAKIFRIGILMYGKAPTLPEILRWAREKG
jgi:ABC-2 type transport system permease protein